MAALRSALEDAFEYDDVALVERFVTGIEINVGDPRRRVLGAIEIAPKSGIYDYEAKYTPGMTEYFMPRVSPHALPRRAEPRRARGARPRLHGRGARRSARDARGERVRARGEHAPGHAPDGLFAGAAAAGYDFGSLCEAILDGARLGQPARRRPNVEPLTHGTFRQSSGASPVAMMKSVG